MAKSIIPRAVQSSCRSEFNRAVQACRQPGSTYKPVYYSLALDKGYGYGSLLNDIPRAEVDPITGRELCQALDGGNLCLCPARRNVSCATWVLAEAIQESAETSQVDAN